MNTTSHPNIRPTPTHWASGEPIADADRNNMKLLRSAGCACELPLLGDKPGVGPRCRTCNTQATRAKPEMMLWLNDARGQYIPRDFANSFADRAKHVSGITDEQWKHLEAGPDDELYWDCWAEVCDRAVITDENGDRFTVWQEGDCWLIPEGMEWDDENQTFKWPELQL